MSAHVDNGATLPRCALRADAGRQELPERHADAAPDRVLAVRHAAARALPARRLDHGPATARTGARRGGRCLTRRAFNRFQNSFSHIFAGATRPATTATSGPRCCRPTRTRPSRRHARRRSRRARLNETGRRFLDEILAVGGSRPAIESFRAFRGRDPSIDALLRHSGWSSPRPDGAGRHRAPRPARPRDAQSVVEYTPPARLDARTGCARLPTGRVAR